MICLRYEHQPKKGVDLFPSFQAGKEVMFKADINLANPVRLNIQTPPPKKV